MTEYTDVPKVNALHAESQQVAQAISILETGGSIGSMYFVPPPFVPPEPGEIAPPMVMPVYVTIPPPVDPAVLTDMLAWLNQRLADIATELTQLGVVVPPVGSATWATPPAPPGMPMSASMPMPGPRPAPPSLPPLPR